MMRRIVVLCVALGLVLGLGLAPAAAKGRCRAVRGETFDCGDHRILSRVCHREGKKCDREGGECMTLWVPVACPTTDGDPQVGMGCFCTPPGGWVFPDREAPISVDEFLELLETLESRDIDGETCEAPPELSAK